LPAVFFAVLVGAFAAVSLPQSAGLLSFGSFQRPTFFVASLIAFGQPHSVSFSALPA
jgi:hypothetical protein